MRKKLGKGLGALIGETLNHNEKKEEILQNITSLPIEQIIPNPKQPRSFFDPEKLKELKNSILSVGLIEPIIIHKKEKKYQIIAGERRFKAAQLANIKEIPVIIKENAEENIMEMMLIENIQREDLSPIEEAVCFEKILDEKMLTHDQLSRSLGKNRTYITNHLRLLKLPKTIQKEIGQQTISMGHAKMLVNIPEEEQLNYIQEIKKNKLSVRSLETKISQNKRKISPNTFKSKNPHIIDFENQLRDFFQTKVSIHEKGNKGKIEIEFYHLNDIKKMMDKLKI